MATSVLINICMFVVFAKLTASQLPCTPNPSPYSGPTLPNIPDSISMDIVDFKVVNGKTSEMVYHLYVDAKNKLAVKGKLLVYFASKAGYVKVSLGITAL